MSTNGKEDINSDEDSTRKVYLYVYDLSNGLAQQLAPQILGIPLKAIYHTSIVIDNMEYSYHDTAISKTPVQAIHPRYGHPIEIKEMGETSVPTEIIEDYLVQLGDDFHGGNYDLFKNNCNHFSNVLIGFLNGGKVEDEILLLPDRVLACPNGEMIKMMFQ